MDDGDRSAHAGDTADSPWAAPYPSAPSAGEPTRRIPVYSQDPGAYTRGGAARSEHPTGPVQPTAFGSPAYVEPGYTGPEDSRKKRSMGLAGAVLVGVCVLLIGLGGGYLVAVGLGSSDPAPVAGDATAQQAAVAPPPATQGGGAAPGGTEPGQAPAGEPPAAPAAPDPHGFGSLGGGAGAEGDGTSAALGVVASIDGTGFVVRTLDGSENRIATDSHTYFATVRGTGGISKLAVGDLVFVGGTADSDGAISADMVLGGAFPELGAGTR